MSYLSGFWFDFLANLLATFVGIIIGIPVALWIDKRIENSQEKHKKEKILFLLRTELLQNLTVLSGWSKSEDRETEFMLMEAFLRRESWDSFSDGGELAWIKDPELLDKIAEAYFAVKSVCLISSKNLQLDVYSSFLNSSSRDYFEKSVAEAITAIQNALQSIATAVDRT